MKLEVTPLKPSICTGVLGELNVKDAVRILAEIGWHYLELYSVHLKQIDESQPEYIISELNEMCDEYNISIYAAHNNTQGVSHERLMKWCKLLGVRWIIIHPMTNKTPIENLDMVSKWAKLASEFNIGIAIENMHDRVPTIREGRAFGSTPSELLWLTKNFNPKLVGICWDTCHAYLQRLDQYQAIKSLGERLVHTHINDNISISEEQHLAPFEGLINWKVIMKALREIKYEGLLNIEGGASTTRLPLEIRKAKIKYLLKLLNWMIKYL